MAGALDRPGDSMAAQSTKPGAASPMKKSCRGSWARRPAKLVMVCRRGMSLTARARFGPHLVQTARGGGGGLLVLDVDGGGADQQVAVDGGGDQNALAGRARQLEHGVADVFAGGVVQQEVVAPAGDDLHGVGGGGHVVQLVGVDAGRVDHQFLPRGGRGWSRPASRPRWAPPG